VRELAEVQKKLLTHVAGSVKPGGKLIFSVCTVTRAETTGVAEHFQANHPDFEPLVLPELNSNGRPIGNAPTVMIWPQDLGGNGMYIAGWRRKKS
jgi:16S rRNA (cytosine967-C5)-methyltransferase